VRACVLSPAATTARCAGQVQQALDCKHVQRVVVGVGASANITWLGQQLDAVLLPCPWWVIKTEPFQWQTGADRATQVVIEREERLREEFFRWILRYQYPPHCLDHSIMHYNAIGRYMGSLWVTVATNYVVGMAAANVCFRYCAAAQCSCCVQL
jgi:hypothetical protein